jgi:hypothetical protein
MFSAAAAAVFCLGACDMSGGERVAGGTGTTAGNTITARVLTGTILTVDGTPAIRAEVTLRPAGYLPWYLDDGTLQLPEAIGTKTDGEGRFAVLADSGMTYLLESQRGSGTAAQVGWVDGISFADDEKKKDLGAVSLSQASALTGTLVGAGAGPASTTAISPQEDSWIGFPGTENFHRLGPDGSFELTDIPPGVRTLEILRRMNGVLMQRVLVSGWRVFAGSQASLDPVLLPPLAEQPEQAPMQISAAACVENVNLMAQSEYAGPTNGGDSRVLRAMLASDPPRWIELDPCLGIWRTLLTLPSEAAHPTGVFSDADADFLVLDNPRRILKIGRDHGLTWMVSSPVLDMASAEWYGGKYYAMMNGTRSLYVYPDADHLWKGEPADSVDLGLSIASLDQVAIQDSVIYLGTASDGLRVWVKNLRSGIPGRMHATHSTARMTGLTTRAEGGLWLINAHNHLEHFNPDNGAIPSRIQVRADYPLVGLTRYRSADEGASGSPLTAPLSVQLPSQPAVP